MVRQGGNVRPSLNRLSAYYLAILFLSCNPAGFLMAEDKTFLIDDRSSGDMRATTGRSWRFVADGVMGGVSDGSLEPGVADDRPCLRLQGEVRLENNGGFIQAALEIPDQVLEVIGEYTGIMLEVSGNGEEYNLHLRTGDLWLPWQSYRSTFTATPEWQTLYLPFAGFEPYRTGKPLDVRRLKKVGVLAIGRAFTADLCIGRLALYH